MEWRIPSTELKLSENEVHVWRAFLDLPEYVYNQLKVTLSPDEQVRAARFRFESDHRRFVARRGILRVLLGRYLGELPDLIKFCYGPQGKPALRSRGSSVQLNFNLSHSHGVALFAFSGAHDVGVDLEYVRPGFASQDVAERFFSPEEVAEFRALPVHLRDEGFFLCWTRKEAYIKARGEGLQIPLNSFSVSLTPGQPEKLQSQDSRRWAMRSFAPVPAFVSALVIKSQEWRLRGWEWGVATNEIKEM